MTIEITDLSRMAHQVTVLENCDLNLMCKDLARLAAKLQGEFLEELPNCKDLAVSKLSHGFFTMRKERLDEVLSLLLRATTLRHVLREKCSKDLSWRG